MGSAMFLSTYQRAILQEMGIPLWIEQASQHDIVDEHNANSLDNKGMGVPEKTHQAPHLSSEDKQARLAQLRAQVVTGSGGESSRSDAPDKTITATVPLTPVQHKQSLLWLNDIDIALSHVGVALTRNQVTLGQKMQVSDQEITLPAAPHRLSAEQCRALWQALCAVADKK